MKQQIDMKDINRMGLTVLSGAATALTGALAAASLLRRDGGAALCLFCFAYIMFDVTRGFIREGKEDDDGGRPGGACAS